MNDRLLFALLYFSEGVPIGFLWWALPSVLREQSMDVGRITTLTAALSIPWTIKFLAGPVVDRSTARGVRLRSWILVCQAVMGLTLLPLAAGNSVPEYSLLLGLLLTHACFAATQDVAIDALCIRSVPVDHLGTVNGWMQFGMTAGRASAAAAVPLLMHVFGWQVSIWAIALLVWLPMPVVMAMVREPAQPDDLVSDSRASLRNVLSWTMVPAVGVALLAGTGFESTGALTGPLLVDLGFDAGARSLFFGAVAPAGLATGGLLAARLTHRIGLRWSAALGVVAAAVSVAALAVTVSGETLPVGQAPQIVLLAVVYLSAGVLISATYACFMSVARGPWRATRFSLFMGLTNACETGSGFVGGRLVGTIGYGGALAALAGLSLLSLPFLRRMDEVGDHQHGEQ